MYKNIHKGKDIYIIAAGKSLDYIDNSFFKNKITIGINQVYKKFEPTYLIRKEAHLIKETLNSISKKCILFISRGHCGGNNNINLKIIQKLNVENKIIIFNHNLNIETITKLPPEDKIIVSWSTITSGIHLAAYMGAKNIILVGHDCGTLDNECNFNGYHTDKTYRIAWKNGGKNAYKKWLPKIEEQTIDLKSLLRDKYNCNIYSLNPFINFGLEGHKYNK